MRSHGSVKNAECSTTPAPRPGCISWRMPADRPVNDSRLSPAHRHSSDSGPQVDRFGAVHGNEFRTAVPVSTISRSPADAVSTAVVRSAHESRPRWWCSPATCASATTRRWSPPRRRTRSCRCSCSTTPSWRRPRVRPTARRVLLDCLADLTVGSCSDLGADLVLRRGDWVDEVAEVVRRRRRDAGPPERGRQRLRASNGATRRLAPALRRAIGVDAGRAPGITVVSPGRDRAEQRRRLEGLHAVLPPLARAPVASGAGARTGRSAHPGRTRARRAAGAGATSSTARPRPG